MADLTTKAINTYGLNDETLGLGHKVLVVGDSAEYLTLVSDIAKKIVEDYAGSTLLGTAQSVASAFMQCDSLVGVTEIPSNSDLNTYTTPGSYYIGSGNIAKTITCGSNPLPYESTLYITVKKTRRDASYVLQYLQGYDRQDYWVRRGYTNNNTWTAWGHSPTRTEMDSVVNKTSGLTGIFNTDLALSGSSTQRYNVPNSSQHLVILQAASKTAHGLYLVSTTSSGIMQLTEISKGENITVTAPSANTLEIVNAYANACYVTDICLRGSAIIKVTASTNSAQSESI